MEAPGQVRSTSVIPLTCACLLLAWELPSLPRRPLSDGVCLFSRRYHQQAKSKKLLLGQQKLMWGLLYSIKDFVNQLAPKASVHTHTEAHPHTEQPRGSPNRTRRVRPWRLAHCSPGLWFSPVSVFAFRVVCSRLDETENQPFHSFSTSEYKVSEQPDTRRRGMDVRVLAHAAPTRSSRLLMFSFVSPQTALFPSPRRLSSRSTTWRLLTAFGSS